MGRRARRWRRSGSTIRLCCQRADGAVPPRVSGLGSAGDREHCGMSAADPAAPWGPGPPACTPTWGSRTPSSGCASPSGRIGRQPGAIVRSWSWAPGRRGRRTWADVWASEDPLLDGEARPTRSSWEECGLGGGLWRGGIVWRRVGAA